MSSSTCFMSWLTFVVLLADQRRELASVFALNIISYYVLYWHSNSHLDVGCHTELFMRRKWEKVRGCDRDFWSVSAFVFEWYRWFLPPRLQEKAWTPGKAISCYFKFWASCGQVGLHDLIMPCFIRNHVRRTNHSSYYFRYKKKMKYQIWIKSICQCLHKILSIYITKQVYNT